MSTREVFIEDWVLGVDIFVVLGIMAPCALRYRQKKWGGFFIWSWNVVLHIGVYTVCYRWHIGS